MVSTYSSALRLELMATGDQSGTWGVTTNGNLGTLLEQSITGYAAIAQGDVANLTLTTTDGSVDQARNAVIKITGAITAARNVVVQTPNKVYIVVNGTTGGFDLTFKTAGGTGIAVPMGSTAIVYSDGTNVLSAAGDVFVGATPLSLKYTDAGATIGPTLVRKRVSSTPAVSDILSGDIYYGSDSGLAEQEYARTYAKIISPTAASETGGWGVQLFAAGTQRDVMLLNGNVGGAPAVIWGYDGSGSVGFQQFMAEPAAYHQIFGGTDITSASILLLAESNSSQAKDILFTSNNANVYQWDFSALTHTFTGKTVIGGTATNDSASAGQVGEAISSTVLVGSAVSLTTSTPVNITSISLTAGDWDVSGNIVFVTVAATSYTRMIASISQTTNTLDTITGGAFASRSTAANVPGAASTSVHISPIRISLAGTTTIYLVAQGTFTVDTLTGYGHIKARRAR